MSLLTRAATQDRISSVVMMMELTGNMDPLVVPLARATVGAATISRLLVTGSIYGLLLPAANAHH